MSEPVASTARTARRATIEEIAIADEPANWRALGFATTDDDSLSFGTIRVSLRGSGAGRGIVGWSLRGVHSTELDGLPTVLSPAPLQREEDVSVTEHPNGVLAVDHVVAFSPRLDRSVEALRGAGLDLRRVREQPTPAGAPRQAFFRLGEAILELVQIPAGELERAGGVGAPARFWGLALRTGDLERTVAAFGSHVSEIRPAVQPGRRIATVRRSAGLAVPVALISAPGA